MAFLEYSWQRTVLFFALLLTCALVPARSVSQPWIQYREHEVFLNGCNIAWVNFAADIGPGVTNLAAFRSMFDSVRARGGNSMRLWLHTTGATSPAFDASGLVMGPGNGTISDLEAILNLAWDRRIGLLLCLWSFDMLRISNGSTVTGRAMRILTDTIATAAYVNNSLIPMVTALRGHPGILAWEVFNEAEGMSNEFGWDFTYHVPMAHIQRFVNLVAAAVHRTDTMAQVTNGAWSFLALSDQNPVLRLGEPGSAQDAPEFPDRQHIEDAFAQRYGERMSADSILARFKGLANSNYYRDDRLIAAGGQPDGILDFYTVHYYDWGGTAISPFHHAAWEWGLDKPLAVAEFYALETFGVPYGELYRNLYDNGYAGAMVWSWNDNATQQARSKILMRDLYLLHASDLDLDPVSGRIYSFTTTRSQIESGDPVTVAWQTTPGSAVTLDGVAVATKDSLIVSPAVTSAFELVSQGAVADTAILTISVIPAGRILSFTASPSTIGVGETALLRWSTARGSAVKLDGSPVNEDDSLLVAPHATTILPVGDGWSRAGIPCADRHRCGA